MDKTQCTHTKGEMRKRGRIRHNIRIRGEIREKEEGLKLNTHMQSEEREKVHG